MQQWGINERGEKLSLQNWHLEYAELIGDFRVNHTLTTGCSQVGKTLMHSLLLCFCITEGGLNTLWSYDQERSLNIQVSSNFRPVMEKWLKARKIEESSKDAKNNTIYQVQGTTAQFVYVSTSKLKDTESGTAAAGGIAVGVSRDILFKEERSQYPPGASDPLNRRLDAGRLPTRPIRELGTPGSGNGIEAEIENADYHFYPHYKCCECGAEKPLHPKGCLLKPDKSGNFLTQTGSPLNWWQIDGEAIFACPNCLTEIDSEVRSQSWFRCIKTGIDLRKFLDDLPTGEKQPERLVAITLSPLLRIRRSDLAQSLINEGLRTLNTDDWQQQALGEPSVSSADGVTLEILKKAISRPSYPKEPDFTICGIDQGRAEYWLWKCQYYLPSNWEQLPLSQQIEQVKRQVVFAGDVVKGEVLEKISDCDFGIIDNEPDISAAANLASESCLELADQQSGMLDDIREGVVREGGDEHSCWKFRNEKFLKIVLYAFLEGRYKLPSDWDRWLGMPTERSPLIHLVAPKYDAGSGKWKRPKNHVDDLYYSAMFCEVGCYLYLREKFGIEPIFDVGEEREVYQTISKF